MKHLAFIKVNFTSNSNPKLKLKLKLKLKPQYLNLFYTVYLNPCTLTVCYFILDKLNSEGPQAKTGIIPYPDCPPLHL